MGKQQKIIPEFMIENPNDSFKILLPLRIKLDNEKIGNSHFEVVIKNMTTKKVFKYYLAPELLLAHLPIETTFKNGIVTKYFTNSKILDQSFLIDTNKLDDHSTPKLHNILDSKHIMTLIGWDKESYKIAKYINCYLFEDRGRKIIIPHYAIAIYYYFRFSDMREAAFECNLESLYRTCDLQDHTATIILNKPRNNTDAAFIHRYATNTTAHKAFENIGTYINAYLKYMFDNDLPYEEGMVPIKASFPIKEKFQIDTRALVFTNESSNETYHFVLEIINDYSNMGFDKFIKLTENNKFVTNMEDLTNLPIVNQEKVEETTEVLKIEHANKRYTHSSNHKIRNIHCGSMANIEVESSHIERDTVVEMLKILQEYSSEEAIDQSMTESSSSGTKRIRKVVVSSDFIEELQEEEKDKAHKNEIDNFVVFRQYMDFLGLQEAIKDLMVNPARNLPELCIHDTDIINQKGRIKGRAKQYLIATFIYKNLYVGVLELENYPSSAAASWVIISKNQLGEGIFQHFIHQYLVDDKSTGDFKKLYSKEPLKFITKNHERNENLTNEQLAKWYVGLLGKCTN